MLYHRIRQRRKREIRELETALNVAAHQRSEIQRELRQLKVKDYESLIAAKDKREQELTLSIKDLQKRLGNTPPSDSLSDFSNSPIALQIVKEAEMNAEHSVPSESEWNLLTAQFSQHLSQTYQSFGSAKPLSMLEQRTCILLLLNIPEKAIAVMTQSSTPTISQAKARANEKLFGKKDAPSLKINLINHIRQFD